MSFLINKSSCVKKEARRDSFPSRGNSITRVVPLHRYSPAEVSNPGDVQSAKPRSTTPLCSTSMTIAGNFIRSVCTLAPRTPSLPPSLSSSPRNPALIHVAIHSPFARSFISPHPGCSIQFRGRCEFARGGNLFNVTSPAAELGSLRVSHARTHRTHASCRNLPRAGIYNRAPDLEVPK